MAQLRRSHLSFLLVSVFIVSCGPADLDPSKFVPSDLGKDGGASSPKPTGDSGTSLPPPATPVCGDKRCSAGESCSSCEKDCGGCNMPCDTEGGVYCGGNTVDGNPEILYVCKGGVLQVKQDCLTTCTRMPAGTPDECPPPPPVCGDGQCNGQESCGSCAKDCGQCNTNLACDTEGGKYCGGNTVGGDANTLYVCRGGFLQVEKNCGKACQAMPAGIPDQCPGAAVEGGCPDVPASLVSALSGRPYTEGSCSTIKHPLWPYDAQSCNYTASGVSASVVSANPSPQRVACWIVDAAKLIPVFNALKGTNQAAYERGLLGMASFITSQSGRIFPIEGIVVEPGICSNGGRCNFDHGVSSPCTTGCYCRINSLHRTTWCKYQAYLGKQSYDECLNGVGRSNYTNAWGNRCLANHIDAWNSEAHESFRAAAYAHNLTISSQCPPGACSASAIGELVYKRYTTINPTF